VLAIAGLGAAVWLAEPLTTRPLAAAPVAQVEPSPTARPTPRPTLTAEQDLQRLTRDNLQRQNELIDLQKDRVRQERDIANQPWRAPADATGSFGPTLVGVALAYMLSRALRHWIPSSAADGQAPPAGASPGFDDEEDDL
jgi:hypothetical protein